MPIKNLTFQTVGIIGFRASHRTESALLRVSNDILLGADSGSPIVLLLLDLSAAFDPVDHDVLIDRLKDQVSIQGLSLDWFSTYFGGRTISVGFGNCSASVAPLMHVWCSSGLYFGTCFVSLYLLPSFQRMLKTSLFSLAFNNGL